jgi:DNA repair exonuclease SbcCD ATPase subunit
LKSAIDGIDSRIKSLSDIESFLTDIQTRIETASKEIAELGPKEQELKKMVEELRERLSKKESAWDILTFIDTALLEVAQAEKELKTLEKVYETNIDSIRVIEESVAKKKELEQQKEDADELVDETTAELTSYNAKLVRITEYEERQETLMQSRDLLKVVKEALDIKTGIPLYLLGSYLEGIKEETNRLLNLAFGDGFSIDFEVSDTEFNIPVYKNGTPFGKDITDCSQGETALVKCSLSLGITSRAIRQAETKYNLVYLDEVDAELDTNNRYKFLEILEKQLDALACEQCFVITHNDAFLNAEVGLIMLKGATFDISDESAMFNKDVIADFRKEIK